MATYRQIHTHIWDDPKFEELSPVAKLLFIYGFSNKHRNEAGIYVITVRKMAFETGLTVEQTEEAIKEIESKGMWHYDRDNCVLWVKNALKYQSVSSKCLVAILKDLESVNSPLVTEFKEYYKDILNRMDTLSIPYPNPNDTLAGNTNTKTKTKSKTKTKGKGKNNNTPPLTPPQNGEGESASTPEPQESQTAEQTDLFQPLNEYPPEFEEFWQLYPRKVEKKRAFKCWQARRREGVPATHLALAAKHYAQKCAAQGTEERYIKHPATFLGPSKPYEDYIRPPTPAETKNVPKAWHKLKRYFEEDEGDDKTGSSQTFSFHFGGLS